MNTFGATLRVTMEQVAIVGVESRSKEQTANTTSFHILRFRALRFIAEPRLCRELMSSRGAIAYAYDETRLDPIFSYDKGRKSLYVILWIFLLFRGN